MTVEALNAWLDRLPRTLLGRGGRLVPSYRTLGIVGYYLALVTVLGGGLVRGLSLLAAAGVAAVSGLSFFLYAWARKAATGKEEIVLLEHVWFAIAVVAAFLWALGEPLLSHLDVFAVSLCPFLALGRVGCLLAGCCHGRPSRVGVVYGEEAARDGFARHLVGVRLLPVPAFEALGLLLLGVTGFAGLLFAAPGAVLVWLLVGYAVLRFGLEGLRGDGGPELLGFSEARWMCLVQFASAVALWEGLRGEAFPSAAVSALWAGFGLLLVAALGLRHRWDPERTLLAPAHLEELTALLAACAGEAAPVPAARATSLGVTAAVSTAVAAQKGRLHVSLALPGQERNLALLCRLAVAALPGLEPESARYTDTGFLHCLATASLAAPDRGERDRRFGLLYGGLLRELQRSSFPSPSSPPAPGAPGGQDAGYFRPRLARAGDDRGPHGRV